MGESMKITIEIPEDRADLIQTVEVRFKEIRGAREKLKNTNLPEVEVKAPRGKREKREDVIDGVSDDMEAEY